MKKIVLISLVIIYSVIGANAELMRIEFTSPGTFKADTGRFSDAYYIMKKAPIEIRVKVYNDSFFIVLYDDLKLKIFQETSEGNFDSIPILEHEIDYEVKTKDSTELVFIPTNGKGAKFFPKTYYDLLQENSDFKYPTYFSNMLRNVTPRYLLKFDSLGAFGEYLFGYNSKSRIVRFYINNSNKIILSVENSATDLNTISTDDQIAGRLNSDSLIKNCNYILGEHDPFPDYCIFERTNWEENTVDYSQFDYLFWSDGDDKPISKIERKNIINFLESGTTDLKKNLMICSQELAREHGSDGTEPDSIFLTSNLRSFNFPPGNPKGEGVSCENIQIKGEKYYGNPIFTIDNTKYENDVPPYCGIIRRTDLGEGLFKTIATYFPDSSFISEGLIAGMSVNTLTKNIRYYTIDWRHFQNSEYLLRTNLDFFDRSNYKDYDKINFIEKERIDTNLNNYSGDTLKFRFRYGYYTTYYGDPKDYYYGNNSDVYIWNQFFKEYDTIRTDNDGYANYQFEIPEDIEPKFYIIELYTISTKLIFKIKVNFNPNDVDDLLTNSIGFQISPNPTQSTTKIEFTLDYPSIINLCLYDALGNKVKQFDLGFKEQGTHIFNFDTYDLPQGLYFLKMQAGEKVEVGKMLLY